MKWKSRTELKLPGEGESYGNSLPGLGQPPALSERITQGLPGKPGGASEFLCCNIFGKGGEEKGGRGGSTGGGGES